MAASIGEEKINDHTKIDQPSLMEDEGRDSWEMGFPQENS